MKKLKESSNTLLKFFTLYCIIYIINLPKVFEYTDAEIRFKTNMLVILYIFVISAFVTIIPSVHYINKGDKLDLKTGKRVCLANTGLCFIFLNLFSIVLVKNFNIYFLISNSAMSFLFYYINLILSVDYKVSNKRILNIICYLIITITILLISFISINYVKSSLDPSNLVLDESYLNISK